MQEQDIIRRYFGFSGGGSDADERLGVKLGVGDDAAVLSTPPGNLVVSTDTLNADVHFFADAAPYTLARKSAAVSLSDIAAMGGAALWLTAALTAPPATASDWFEQFARGLRDSSEEYGYAVVGGDLTRGAALSITTTVIGICTQPPATRSAAQVGDDVWLSGSVGGAAHALGIRLGELPAADDMRESERCLHDPRPRLHLAAAIADVVHAMMDVSDGLLITAQEIAAQSGVGLQIDAAQVPAPSSLAVLPAAAARQCQFTGGDDYELLFTAAPAAAAQIRAVSDDAGAPVRIGSVVNGSGVEVHANGEKLDFSTAGYQHDFS